MLFDVLPMCCSLIGVHQCSVRPGSRFRNYKHVLLQVILVMIGLSLCAWRIPGGHNQDVTTKRSQPWNTRCGLYSCHPKKCALGKQINACSCCQNVKGAAALTPSPEAIESQEQKHEDQRELPEGSGLPCVHNKHDICNLVCKVHVSERRRAGIHAGEWCINESCAAIAHRTPQMLQW